jgi:hypothetical protein
MVARGGWSWSRKCHHMSSISDQPLWVPGGTWTPVGACSISERQQGPRHPVSLAPSVTPPLPAILPGANA